MVAELGYIGLVEVSTVRKLTGEEQQGLWRTKKMRLDHKNDSMNQGHRLAEHARQSKTQPRENLPFETWHKTQQHNPMITTILTWTSLTLTKATAKDEAMEKH